MTFPLDCFPADYFAARDAFVAAARVAGCSLESHGIRARGPGGETLSVDVALGGDVRSGRVLVISSGLHGAEGFFGSAVQTAWLSPRSGAVEDSEASPPVSLAVVLIHALNPWGFAHVRRADQRNVDLNRNFLLPGEAYAGSPPLYSKLDPALNPPRPPSRLDAFPLHALRALARHGRAAVAQAVAGGQYDFPAGLFFGGREESETTRLLREHLPRWVGGAERVLHLDLHTGLGPRATYRLLADLPLEPNERWLRDRFGDLVVEPAEVPEGFYHTRGSLGSWCRALFPDHAYSLLVAEFGTYSPLRVLSALRRENQAHHFCRGDDPRAVRAKRDLREAFCPESLSWRGACVSQALDLIARACRSLIAETALDERSDELASGSLSP